MEAAALTTTRGWPRVKARAAVTYSHGAGNGKRDVVGAGLAPPGIRRTLVAAIPVGLEPLSLALEGAVTLAPDGDEEEIHGDVASAGISSPSDVTGSGKTVRVRFVLKKECPFGQSFHLVGDDPALGLWDPSKAVALDWSEGHDWTAEEDLPANRLIEFKFLLQDLSGKLQWQNGPNRSIQTGETSNILVVYEDWGNVENQMIEEDDEVPVGMEEGVILDDGENRNDVISADELQLHDNQKIIHSESSTIEDDKKATVATGASVQGESSKVHEANQPELIVDEIQEVLHEKADAEPDSGVATHADNVCTESTDDDSTFSEDGIPVENGWTDAFEHELLWGWKALQKLLMNLGFKMDTS
ncbi:hypothetical protein GUJ93_ZPchr0010g7865 [Zizania palustris]|uniref:CBM20 domain-containing protein n=1 Tax=Zizania palustris TaxID=103762 RepID=A0A8J5WAN5_ZIZPA|nr:hypothetical protein GUJ93_ZPchr0010g7865 [Zizania palustris]